MTIEFLDPGHESDTRNFVPAKRLASLQGATIGILSNGKKGTKPFFDALAKELRERHGIAQVVRLTKSNYSAPAEAALLHDAGKWQALIAGVGD
jgi:hypothetical protein